MVNLRRKKIGMMTWNKRCDLPPLMLISGVRRRCEVDLPPLNGGRGVISVSNPIIFFLWSADVSTRGNQVSSSSLCVSLCVKVNCTHKQILFDLMD